MSRGLFVFVMQSKPERQRNAPWPKLLLSLACLLYVGCASSQDAPHANSPSSDPSSAAQDSLTGAEASPEKIADETTGAWYNYGLLRPLFGDYEKVNAWYLTDQKKIQEYRDRGKYLVTIAACGNCHGQGSNIPGSPLVGGRELQDRYGAVLAPNITPCPETGIGTWNIRDVVRALRGSIDQLGRPLSLDLHAGYRWMTDRDAYSIAIYLMAQNPVKSEVKRRRIGGLERNRWLFMPEHQDVLGYVPEQSGVKDWHYGRYLALHVANCATCHTKDGGMFSENIPFAGTEDKGKASVFKLVKKLMTGGFKSEEPKEAVAPYLSPDAQQMLYGKSSADQLPAVNTQDTVVSSDVLGEEKVGGEIENGESVESGTYPILGPDIRGQSASGLAFWEISDVVRYLTTGKTPEGVQRNAELCPWPNFNQMTLADKEAIAQFLKTL